MKIIRYFLFFISVISFVHVSAARKKGTPKEERLHPLDIVFCLDLSGSTNGLIDDVREQLWTIINQANLMEPAPDLRIGIIGFSRPSFGKEQAYVKVLSNLTTDFDSLAYELYKLRPAVEQGSQYVNAALTVAMNEINWGKEASNTKLVFVVGNGMASQRGIDIVSTCSLLAKRHIIVNSLFVVSKGKNQGQALGGWRKIAELTGGLQGEIAVGKKEAVSDLDFNFNELIDLNHVLNSTYLFHGDNGKTNYRRFNALDSALYLEGLPYYYQRVWYKQSARFQNTQAHWDLIDYIKSPIGDLDKVNPRTITDSLQFYSPTQLRELIISKKEAREVVLRNLRLLYKNNYVQTTHKKFLNHEFPDSNIFSRSVINMLLQEWK